MLEEARMEKQVLKKQGGGGRVTQGRAVPEEGAWKHRSNRAVSGVGR